jgi:hypothetical protein
VGAGGSPHFQHSEFVRGAGANLTEQQKRSVDYLVSEWLHPLREQFGRCTVHSGKRTKLRNRLVGGAPRSKHVYNAQPSVAAADVSFERGTPREWAAAASRLNPLCGIGVYPGHLHIDSRRAVARW